jgi:hypothetical protein
LKGIVMGRSATHKLLIRLSVVGAALCPVLSFALGLSDIQVDSRLNQPLRARIEVFDVTDEEWTHVQTRLNRQSAPDTPALQPEILESVTVRTVQDAHHRHFVEVRSTEPLAEPLFDLPVEIAGPSGHVIRNYPVLLDPPGPGDDVRNSAEEAAANRIASADGGAAATQAAVVSRGQTVTNDPTAASGQAAATAAADRPSPTDVSTFNATPSNATPSNTSASNTGHHVTKSTRGRHHRHAAHGVASGARAASTGAQQYAGADALTGAQQLGAAEPTAAKHPSSAAKPQPAGADQESAAANHNPAAASGTPAAAGSAPAAANATPATLNAASSAAATDSTQQQLLTQLQMLQQTLNQMQQTISAQNAQIADLTAKVARAESRASSTESQAPRAATTPRPTTADSSRAQSTEADTTDAAGETDTADDVAAAPRPYFWLTVILAVMTFVTIVSAIVIKWLGRHAARKLAAANRAAPEQREFREHRRNLQDSGSFEYRFPTDQLPRTENRDSTDRGAATNNAAQYSDPQHSDAQYSGEGPKRSSATSPSFSTPAAQQRQMEADGRVQIDWDKELWNKPEWLKLFGEQPALSDNQPAAHSHDNPAAAAGGNPTAGFPSQDPPTEEVPNAYFSNLPKVSTPQPPAIDLGDLTDTMTEKIFGDDTEKLAEAYAAAIREHVAEARLGRDLSTAIEADAAADAAINSETAKLIEVDPAELLDSATTRLSDEQAAELLSADVTHLTETDVSSHTGSHTEVDLTHLADLASLTEVDEADATTVDQAHANRIDQTHATRVDRTQATDADRTHLSETDIVALAKVDAATLGETDITRLSGTNTTKLADTHTTKLIDASTRSGEDPNLSGQHAMSNSPRLRRRRAGRR